MRKVNIFVATAVRGGLLAASITGAALLGAPAHAQSEGSVLLSALAVASAADASGAAVAGASSAVASIPAALSVAGATLTIKAVQASGNGTVYLLERASDGTRASVALAARSAGTAAHAVGTVVTCSLIATGVVLSVAGDVMAFVPNAAGRALLHNEKLP